MSLTELLANAILIVGVMCLFYEAWYKWRD